jgi:hypothetical protein
MPSTKDIALVFTPDELDLLGRTADALSAYMGKPVLAQVIDAEETGFEWVIFAIPLGVDEDVEDQVVVQIGGAGARVLGNQGGLILADGDVFDCDYLWAIQLSDLEGVRYIKVDQEGDEIAWTDDLKEILPFAVLDELPPEDEDENDDEEDDDDDDDSEDVDIFDPADTGPRRTLH